VIILLTENLSVAKLILARIRECVEAHHFKLGNDSHRITISGGVAIVDNNDNLALSLKSALKVADQQLYTAKDMGRNRIIINNEADPI